MEGGTSWVAELMSVTSLELLDQDGHYLSIRADSRDLLFNLLDIRTTGFISPWTEDFEPQSGKWPVPVTQLLSGGAGPLAHLLAPFPGSCDFRVALS